MTEEKEKPAKPRKKKSAAPREEETIQRLQSGSVGEILRAARMQKGLGLEEISSAIHVRAAQLRAIEEGNIGALPGMTYALGFVKSYAGYLKLNSAEVVQKFKTEHGAPPAAQQLHFPEPIADSPQPNIIVIGVAAFCVVLLLVFWAVFSGGDDEAAPVAQQIPQAPAVGSVTGITANAPAAPASLAGGSLLSPAPAVPAAAPPGEKPQPVTAALEPATQVTAPSETPAAAAPQEETQTPDAPAPEAVAAAEVKAEPAPEVKPEAQEETKPAPVVVKPASEKPAANPDVITIKRGKGHIVLAATQSSWVVITNDKDGSTVLKKVLRPGEQYYVPDLPDLVLLTSNAGGLDVYVDGAKVQALGRTGEIVRGVDLDPKELKKTKVKARDRR